MVHLPRFASMPWSAPVFDDRSPTVDPQLYCMSSSGGLDALGDYREPSCTCLTEQGTAYDISDGECRRVARLGMPYNPYRERRESRGSEARHEPQRHAQERRQAPGIGGAFGEVASYGDYGIATGRYVGQGVGR